jgi:hypothetical protein
METKSPSVLKKKAVKKTGSEKMIQLRMNKRQFVDLFLIMEDSDREDIYEELRRIHFLSKVNDLRSSMSGSQLTMEEITAEVETVRKERYESGRQIIG